jgi:spore maturation protein CgeB
VKILLVTNKTLSNGKVEWVDGGYWNVFLPLQALGHEVYFYDTVKGDERPFKETVKQTSPDLIFCCMTGDKSLTPHEPWEEIKEITQEGKILTFNWFCDDEWRYESFSRHACSYFHVSSTTNRVYIPKYHKLGYKNIIMGPWHVNSEFYSKNTEKSEHISFCGQLNYDRITYMEYLKSNGVNVFHHHGLEHKKMLEALGKSMIGINFSKNYNGNPPPTQLKLRPFEVTGAQSLLLSEYHDGIEEFFEIDKEIVCYSSPQEMFEKARFLLNNPEVAKKISDKGYSRFVREHESKKRLEKVLSEITSL